MSGGSTFCAKVFNGDLKSEGLDLFFAPPHDTFAIFAYEVISSKVFIGRTFFNLSGLNSPQLAA
jgi:hypothetical protein